MNSMLTFGPVEDLVLMKIRTHSEPGHVMVHPQHVLVRVPRVQHNPHPRQQQHGRGQLVVPAEDAHVTGHVEGLGVLRQAWVRGK